MPTMVVLILVCCSRAVEVVSRDSLGSWRSLFSNFFFLFIWSPSLASSLSSSDVHADRQNLAYIQQRGFKLAHTSPAEPRLEQLKYSTSYQKFAASVVRFSWLRSLTAADREAFKYLSYCQDCLRYGLYERIAIIVKQRTRGVVALEYLQLLPTASLHCLVPRPSKAIQCSQNGSIVRCGQRSRPDEPHA